MLLQKFILATITIPLLSSASPFLPNPAPTPVINPKDPTYNCGYVLIWHNSSASASVFARNECTGIYFDRKKGEKGDWAEAYAYKMCGGCMCGFYSSLYECKWWERENGKRDGNVDQSVDMQIGEGGRAEGDGEQEFLEPHPSWYHCARKA